MLQMPSGTSYEIDPNKCRGQDVSDNQKAVKYVAGKFIDIMMASYVALPLLVLHLFNLFLANDNQQDLPRDLHSHCGCCVGDIPQMPTLSY